MKSKVLFGIAVSMVLAMAVGSFALNETQTPASPRAVEAQSAVGATVGPFTVEGGTQGTDYDYASPVLTIHSGDLTVSTSAQTAERIVVDGAATITLAGVNIDRSSETDAVPALTITDNAQFNVKILLADGSSNILKGKKGTDSYNLGSSAIQKNDDGSVGIDDLGTLTIGVPEGSAGTGKLEAIGGNNVAAIGGGYSKNGSKIEITGGEVTAVLQDDGIVRGGAVIGGGQNGNGRNITITGGKVTATGAWTAASIGGGKRGSGSNITITGGVVTAISSNNGDAGIGGGEAGSGSNITITGGEVTAIGGNSGAGIGGGDQGSGSYITIEGGKVRAISKAGGAGIGGGYRADGDNIKITGGEVMAIGGSGNCSGYSNAFGSGIGGGAFTRGSNNNSLSGDAVVLAASDDTSKAALEGFDSLLTQGIVFTGLVTDYTTDPYTITWDANGTMYGNVTLSQDLEIPANLTIPAGQILSIKEGKEVTLSEKAGVKYTVEGELRNNGIATLPADLEVNAEGKVTTAITYDAQDGTITNADEYKTYQDSSEIKAYSELPNVEKDGCVFEGWYTERDGGGTKVEETSLVLLNQHILYANWTANPEPSPEPEPEPIPDPSVEPGHGGDGSDASSKTGDSFAGIAALSILGLATTGAVMLRKRK